MESLKLWYHILPSQSRTDSKIYIVLNLTRYIKILKRLIKKIITIIVHSNCVLQDFKTKNSYIIELSSIVDNTYKPNIKNLGGELAGLINW